MKLTVATVLYVPVILIIVLKCSIHYIHIYVEPVTQLELFEKSTFVPKVATVKIWNVQHTLFDGAVPNNHCQKSEVSITFCCQLGLTHHTAVQIKNFSKSPSVIKVAHTVGNYEPNWHVSPSAKMNGMQRTMVSPWRMHCTHRSKLKGTSQAESNVK